MAVAASLLEVCDAVPGAAGLAAEQLRRVRWEQTPRFLEPGRTSWTRLPEPIEAPGLPVGRVAGLKLKGVGLAGPELPPTPPTGRGYERTISHVGIEEDGSLALKFSAAAPEGGMFLDRARAEFENARQLLESGCPAVVPIALYEFGELRCELDPGRPLGVVLTGSPSPSPERADTLFGAVDLAVAAALARRFGRTLRRFHAAGLYRFNAYPGNYQALPGEEMVCLVDLDSSRPLAECSPARAPLEVLRDFAGGMFYLTATMIQPGVYAGFDPAGWGADDPLAAFAGGYFEDAATPAAEIGAATRWHFGRKWSGLREAERSGGEAAVARFNWRLDRDWLVVRTMAEAVPAYLASDLARRWPLDRDAALATLR